MLKIKNITKNYGDNAGNFDINLEVKSGQIYGIIGPNGAGKTTLIRQVMGFVKPEFGEITVNGIIPFNNIDKITSFTGYVPGEVSLHNELKGIEYLKIVYDFKMKNKDNDDWNFVEKLIKHFDLNVNKKIRKMSKGMKQKIALISAVMCKPKFIVFDEPTSGLDPVMQEQFNDMIYMLKIEYRTTVLICSHIFMEISKLCDKVGIIKEGRLIKEFDMHGKSIEDVERKFREVYKKENHLYE
ncbi:ABC transporter ATP-binding protein [Spiroplasma endosymbiont of Othius punctulatus]|uniref:ABC transporter ATP-binding protein n=1 Tax=Spiroplasma endosymbiont of Othius punctulatus TaxID=3066289 RepID=UPI0030CE2FEF